MKSLIKIFIISLFLLNCKNKEGKIEYILHRGDERLWGVYDKNFNSKGFSYLFIKNNNDCKKYDEKIISEGGKLQLDPYNIKIFFNMKDFNEDYYLSWDVRITNGEIYLRCMFDCYRVLNYNEKYFKLITRDIDTIYLFKTGCIARDCCIPNQIEPAPF